MHVLLAMQKVVGSNPISRFRKGLHLQVFFVRAVGWCVSVVRQWLDSVPLADLATGRKVLLSSRFVATST